MEVRMRTSVATTLAVVLASLAACASYPAPTEHLANSAAAVRGAQEVGASASPQAALHLRLAQEEIAKAKALMDDGNNERADFMALRGKADAELALAITREDAARAHQQQSAAKLQAVEPAVPNTSK
jgi:hypothetical protein